MSRIPLLEVAFEIRFQPENNLATKLLLETNNEFPNSVKVETSEGSKIPEEIKVQQNDLYYVPSYKVVYKDFSLLVSDGSLVILKNYVTGQYQGWKEFKPLVLKVIDILETKNKTSEIQRYSLKYTNLFNEDYLSSDDLSFSVSLGENEFNLEDNFELRTESTDGMYTTMLRASSQVGVRNVCDVDGKETRLTGFLLIIDLIANVTSFDRHEIEENLEGLHTRVYKEFKNVYPGNKRKL